MSNRERVRAEAERRFPDPEWLGTESHRIQLHSRHAYVEGRTVSAEQVEAAAKASYYATGSGLEWEVSVGKPAKQEFRKRVRAAFLAAGCVIDEDGAS